MNNREALNRDAILKCEEFLNSEPESMGDRIDYSEISIRDLMLNIKQCSDELMVSFNIIEDEERRRAQGVLS